MLVTISKCTNPCHAIVIRLYLDGTTRALFTCLFGACPWVFIVVKNRQIPFPKSIQTNFRFVNVLMESFDGGIYTTNSVYDYWRDSLTNHPGFLIGRLRRLLSWFVTELSSMHSPKVSNEGAEVKVKCEVPRYANSTVLARDYQCQKLGLYGCCYLFGCCVGCSGCLNCLDDVCFSWVDLVFVCFYFYIMVHMLQMFHCVFPSAKLTAAAHWCWWYGITKLLFYLPLLSETFPTDC